MSTRWKHGWLHLQIEALTWNKEKANKLLKGKCMSVVKEKQEQTHEIFTEWNSCTMASIKVEVQSLKYMGQAIGMPWGRKNQKKIGSGVDGHQQWYFPFYLEEISKQEYSVQVGSVTSLL